MKLLFSIFILLPFYTIAQTSPCGSSITIKSLNLIPHNNWENLIYLSLDNFEVDLPNKNNDLLSSYSTKYTPQNTFITHYNIEQISFFEEKNISENSKIHTAEESKIVDLYYDSLGQLTSEVRNSYSQNYSYNKAGFISNIELVQTSPSGCATTPKTYSYIAANKATKIWESGIDSSCLGWKRLKQITYHVTGNHFKKGKETKRKYSKYLGKIVFNYSSEGLPLEFKKLDKHGEIIFYYKIKYKFRPSE